MQNFGMRLLVGSLFFLGGMNVIAFGMIGNGSAHPRNPAWQFDGGFLDLEYDIAKGALFLVGITVALALVVVAILSLMPEPKSSEKFSSPIPKREQLSIAEITAKANFLDLSSAFQGKSTEPSQSKTAPTHAPRDEIYSEVTRAPTPEELKEKAIKQIMGRR
ncbi:MAG: hypothetical protein KA715_02280 [Xanthomonadaceae bacterium]|nr:hypothetical protein [Xanthomonadaceae bacterium]